MPYPEDVNCPTYLDNSLILAELNYNNQELRSEFEHLFSQMTAVNKDEGGIFFLYGYGGTGKTYIWKTLASSLRADNKIVIMVASSGIASLNSISYLSCDSVDKSETIESCHFRSLTTEFLNSLTTSGLPNHCLKLKIGTPIMLLRNLDQTQGLCNGTRLIVTRLAKHVIVADIISRTNIEDHLPWPFKLLRRQFPIMLSYAMTINKSQGQSISSVGLYLSKPVFSHGQLYVALSRVKSKKGLRILIHDQNKKK
ncbi:hypothetical protein JHK87_004169 [Glycine soja]|nr:hypothetical protein JHK87_004169 [Glycine soja]